MRSNGTPPPRATSLSPQAIAADTRRSPAAAPITMRLVYLFIGLPSAEVTPRCAASAMLGTARLDSATSRRGMSLIENGARRIYQVDDLTVDVACARVTRGG